MRCGQAWGATAIPSPRSVAQAFADHLNGVLNRTVSEARLTLLADPADGRRFTLAHFTRRRLTAFALNGSSLRLLVSQTIEVVGDHCETANYAYRLASGDEKDAWLLRWEYFRKPPKPDYPYPLAHLHVNAKLSASDAALPKLHVPTRRVPLELVFWHLIAEWGVKPRRVHWQRVLECSIAEFEEPRSAP